MSKQNQITCVDFFAGVGGIRLGFEEAGFPTVFANDNDPYCKSTYDHNFTDCPLTVQDVFSIQSNKLPDFDIFTGGFPCQPFSIAGHRKGFADEGRGNVFFKIAEIIKQKKPRVVFLENVKNLKSHDKGKTFRIILETLEDLGYHMSYKVLNSAEYGGIPQNRERIYIIGFKNKKENDRFSFPDKIDLLRSVSDLLETKVEDKYYYTNKSVIYKHLEEAVVSKDTVYQWRRKYVRENKKGLCPTLTANMGMGGHNVPIIKDKKGIRKLTPRECFRIQGFPDTYRLPNLTDSRLYKQAGNSVSVPVIERIAEEIRKALN